MIGTVIDFFFKSDLENVDWLDMWISDCLNSLELKITLRDLDRMSFKLVIVNKKHIILL